MKSNTSFKVFFLKQYRKNSLKTIVFPWESVFTAIAIWLLGHRTTQNAHCALVIQGFWNCLIFSRFGTNLSTSPALRMKNGNTWIYLMTYWSFIDLERFIQMSFFHLSLRIQIICFSCNFTSICPPCLGFTNEGSGHHCPDLLVNCWCRF